VDKLFARFKMIENYVIKPGDTFALLAARHKIPVRALIEFNPSANPSSLQIGQKIRIPEPADIVSELSKIKTLPGEISDADTLVAAIEEVARQHSLPSDLFKALVSVESTGNPAAQSEKGAAGLVQISPAMQKQLGVSDPTDIKQNLAAGAQILKLAYDEAAKLKNKDGWAGLDGLPKLDALALMIYHAGSGAVQAWLNKSAPTDPTQLEPSKMRGFGPRTLEYPAKVLAAMSKSDPFPGFRLFIKR
jgi:LysM repeat protein